EQLGADRAHWSEVNWTRRAYVVESKLVAEGSPDTVSGRYPLDAWEPSTSILIAGRSMTIEDREADPRLPARVKEGMTRLDMAARIAAPVMVDGELRAVLSVSQRSPRPWSPEEIALVESVASRCWAEVERARAEGALRDREARLAGLKEAFQAAVNGAPL